MSDEQRLIKLTPGMLKNKRGVLIESKEGRVFIPAFCLPEIRRQLGGIQNKLEVMK